MSERTPAKPLHFDQDGIPDELRTWGHCWVCWKYANRNGTTTKLPVDPATGDLADSTDPTTWADFDTAMAFTRGHRGHGVGFVLHKLGEGPEDARAANPFVGLDFDKCRNPETGEIHPTVAAILADLGSYAEVSPSGEGVKVWVRGQLPGGRRRGPFDGCDHAEIYDDGRFFTMTGAHLDDTPRAIKTVDVVALHRQLFGEAKPEAPASTKRRPTLHNLSDRELLDRARGSRNGARFAALFDGDTGGYDSASEADLALVDHLAWWANGDAATVDRLFRASGLYRDKWDERRGAKTYGQRTIDYALADFTEGYTGGSYTGNGNTHNGGDAAAPSEPVTFGAPVTLADVGQYLASINWDWPNRLPCGLLTELVADSGMGKSIFAMRLALTYTTGADWPDGMPYDLPPGEVLWCEGESFLAGHRQRALQMGIPVNKILLPFANVTDGINDVRLGDPERQQAIEYYAITYNVKLIVVDSLSGTSSGDENQSTASAGVRWLAGLAQRTGVPVLLLHHLNKPGKDPTIGQEVTLGRVRGHTSIVQYARVIIAIDAPDAEKPEARRVSWIKSNLGQRPEPLGFTFADGQLAFTEAPRRQRPETLPERAGDLLLSLLASGPKPYAEVERQTEGAGFSLRTVQRAKEKLGILSEKRGEQWFWKLPHTEGIPKQDVF